MILRMHEAQNQILNLILLINPRLFFSLFFSLVVLALLFVALFIHSRRKHKKVLIRMDHGPQLEVKPGQSLLYSLAGQGIFLPTSCGGSGICTLCRCKVTEGGGSLHPAERDAFTAEELTDNWRLACQVKVNHDVKMILPESLHGVRDFEAVVESVQLLTPFIAEIKLRLNNDDKIHFEAGSYLRFAIPSFEIDFAKDIDVPEAFRADWDRFGLRRLKFQNKEKQQRTYSLANPPFEENCIILNIRLSVPPIDTRTGFVKAMPAGVGSSWFFSRKTGDKVKLGGPYGDFHLKHNTREMLFIGGGAGMAPLRSQILHLFQTLKTDRKVSFWYGARSKRELLYVDEFVQLAAQFPNFSFHPALSEPRPNENWTGLTGLIHEVVLVNYLKTHPMPAGIDYYLCGPPMMHSAIMTMLSDQGVLKDHIAFDNFGS